MLCLSESMGPLSARSLSLLLLLSLLSSKHSAEGGSIGVNYGRVANNLPPPPKVVELLKSQGITQVKLYDADPGVLRAFAGSGIRVVVALPNELLAAAASRPGYALGWVQRNVAAYYPATQIAAVAVGNEVFASPRNLTALLVPAMTNVHAALARLGLDAAVKVSSPIALTALRASYPPSAGAFRSDLAEPVMRPMLDLLGRTGSYLMVNAYPFFAYSANAALISLDYALFRPNAGVLDPGSGLKYYSLFDAQVDAVYAAMGAVGGEEVRVVVSETGWPSKGDGKETGAGAGNAAAYNGNLVRRVLSGNAGTPRRPQGDVDVFLFGLFNEDLKPGPTSERNYGLFYPSEDKVYDIDFVLGGGNGSSSSSSSGGGLRWEEERGGKGTGTGERWCVANGVVGKERLQRGLDYACGEGGADCRAIQPGAGCVRAEHWWRRNAPTLQQLDTESKGLGIGTCRLPGSPPTFVCPSPRLAKELKNSFEFRKLSYVLDQDPPRYTNRPTADQTTAQEKWTDDDNKVRICMVSKSRDLPRFEVSKRLFKAKMQDGQSVHDHCLTMIKDLEELEKLLA
ncbi:glucan endo-1,3-beta-glucosidase 10 [Ananas comosus]|uniref:glucan endo-1,3-beta-D-glucosidase n=1 Tax=Ananas comosus TaxID=4615 RepID=A0A6P5F4P1_ANACO|nr:glucan endo-1,3-beta-glucosidase 10 [Ananas comosus]